MTKEELKNLSQSRIKTAEILIEAGDWHMAHYMMGYALEFALKAVICNTLHIDTYPSDHSSKKIQGIFKTHFFDILLLLSGMTDLFDNIKNESIFYNWSLFTVDYEGDWVSERYKQGEEYDKELITKLYNFLYEDKYSIIKTIIKEKRW